MSLLLFKGKRELLFLCMFLWFVLKWLKNLGELRRSRVFQVPLKSEVLQMMGFQVARSATQRQLGDEPSDYSQVASRLQNNHKYSSER